MSRSPTRLLLTVVFVCLVAESTRLLAADTLAIGSPAPDFRLPGVDGKEHSLSDFQKADVLVVVFTCNHCPTAQAYEDRIKQLAADFKNRGVALVAISPNDPKAVRLDELGYSDLSDSLEEMKIRAKDKQFGFPYLYDGEDQKVSRAYGPVATPHVFVFDRERKLRFVGRVDNSENPKRVTSNDARSAIEALLAGKPVPVEKTMVFGCSVKWSDKRDSVKQAEERWAKEEVALKEIDEEGLRKLAKNDSTKLRLINVWATWCGPCVAELGELVKMNRMYRQRDFELVTVSADSVDDKERAFKALREEQVSATNYLFRGTDKYKLMDAIDKEAPGPLPHTILVAPGGKIIYRKSGAINALELKKAIVEYVGRVYK